MGVHSHRRDGERIPHTFAPHGPATRSDAPGGPTEYIRSFIAVELAAPVRAAIAALQRELAAAGAGVRWVRPEHLHLTLKFLGAVAAPRLDEVHAAVLATLASQPVLPAAVRGVGVFPSWRRPRVVWVGLQAEGLADLAARIDAALAPLGVAPERRTFTPHVTLGRVNTLHGWPALEARLHAHHDDAFGTSPVTAVTIFRSTLTPAGARYTTLWTIHLNKTTEGAL